MAAMTGILQGLSDALGKHITYMQQEKLRKGDRAFQQLMQKEGFAHAAEQGAETRTHAAEQGLLGREHSAEQGDKSRALTVSEGTKSRTHAAEQGDKSRELTVSEGAKTRTHAAGQSELTRDLTRSEGDKTRTVTRGENQLSRTHAERIAAENRTAAATAAEAARIHASTEAGKTRTQAAKLHANQMAIQRSHLDLSKKRFDLAAARDPLEQQQIQAQINYLEAQIEALQAPKPASWQSLRPEVRSMATDLAYGLGQTVTAKKHSREELTAILKREGWQAYNRLLQLTGNNEVEAARALAAIWEHMAGTEDVRKYIGKIERNPDRQSHLLHQLGDDYMGHIQDQPVNFEEARKALEAIKATDAAARKAADGKRWDEAESVNKWTMPRLIPGVW